MTASPEGERSMVRRWLLLGCFCVTLVFSFAACNKDPETPTQGKGATGGGRRLPKGEDTK